MGYHLQNHTIITLAPDTLGGGGEGKIIAVTAPLKFSSYVAKIYSRTGDKLQDKFKRVVYMIANKPAISKDKDGNDFFIWPEELLFEDGNFIGFLMKKAAGILLFSLCDIGLGYYPKPNENQKLGQEWSHYSRQHPVTVTHRLKLCAKIADSVHAIHKEGKYVIGDIKPGNIIIQSGGAATLIDLDSCQISENGTVLFDGNVGTPEFNPPDKQNGNKEISWDLFILAIIFYEILCGIHPFAWFCKHPYEDNCLPEDNIKDGLFPHGSNKQLLKSMHEQHDIFHTLPVLVQELFIRCFDNGTFKPSERPSATEWISCLIAKPVIKYFKPSRLIVYNGQNVALDWQTENTRIAEIEGYGKVDVNGSISIIARNSTTYKLIAENEFGSTISIFSLSCHDIPAIQRLVVPIPVIHSRFVKNWQPPYISRQELDEGPKVVMDSMSRVSERVIAHIPKYQAGAEFWSLSKIFDVIKKIITTNL